MNENIEIDFECIICYQKYQSLPKLYNCSKCYNKICDDCYPDYISCNLNCAFCRSPLKIPIKYTKNKKKKKKYVIHSRHFLFPLFFIFIIILLSYAGYQYSVPDNYNYNQTHTHENSNYYYYSY